MSNIPKPLRGLIGTSGGSAAVALLAVASAAVYVEQSRAVAVMADGWGYLDFVLRSIATTPHSRVFAFGWSPSPVALVGVAAFVMSCLAIAALVFRTMPGSPAAAPMALVSALAAAVAPTLALATVRWPDGGGSITNGPILAAQAITVALVWAWSRQARRRASNDSQGAGQGVDGGETAPRSSQSGIGGWLRIGFALTIAYVLTIIVCGSSGIFGYDSFSDHLAVPARWLIRGRIERGVPEDIVTFYPGNFELLVRWTLSLGTDRFAFLLSFGSAAAAVWVIYRIALEIGQSRTAAALSALCAASLQVLAYQSVVVYSDSYTALCLAVAAWLLLVWARLGGDDNRLTFGFGLALGLSLGAKYSAGPPVVVLGLVWLWFAWRGAWRVDALGEDRFAFGRLVRASAVLMVGVLPVMAYWYLRNTVELHNPLYPLSVAGLPGIDIGALLNNAPGPKSTWARLTYPWTEVGHGPGYETGLGPIFAVVGMFALCVAPFTRPRTGSGQRLAWVVVVGAFAVWWNTGVLVPRYGLFPLLMSFLFVGELWTAYASRLLGSVIAASVLVTMLSVGHEMLGGAAYNELMYDPQRPVPLVIADLPPSHILNATGQPFGYYAMGRDWRHQVTNLFAQVAPDDVRRLKPDFVMLPADRESEFVGPLSLTLMGRWQKAGQPSIALWRVAAAGQNAARDTTARSPVSADATGRDSVLRDSTQRDSTTRGTVVHATTSRDTAVPR